MWTLLSRFFPGNLYVYAALAAALFATGFGSAWTLQGWRLDALQAKYDGFVSTTKALGEAAATAADLKAKTDIKTKERADRENKTAIAILRTDIKRMRDVRAGGGGLSAPTPTAGSFDKTCFDPSKFAAALRKLDEGVLGIIESGSEAIIDLDTAKSWAQR